MPSFNLEAILREAGLTVERYGPPVGYRQDWASNGPIGQMVHHTSAPQPYPMASLAGRYDNRVKCNIAPRQDGRLIVVTSDACNYSSGMGSGLVLSETRRGIAPSGMAADRNLRDDVNGNPWYINWEVDHPGDGSDIPAAQWRGLVAGLKAVNEALGFSPEQVIAHAEHTKRKIDPRWNGYDAHQNLNIIRASLDGVDIKPPPPPPTDEGVPVAKFRTIRLGDGFESYDADRNVGKGLSDGHPERVAVRQLQAWLAVHGHFPSATFDSKARPDGLAGSYTIGQVMEFQSSKGLVVDGIVGTKTWTSLSPIEE